MGDGSGGWIPAIRLRLSGYQKCEVLEECVSLSVEQEALAINLFAQDNIVRRVEDVANTPNHV